MSAVIAPVRIVKSGHLKASVERIAAHAAAAAGAIARAALKPLQGIDPIEPIAWAIGAAIGLGGSFLKPGPWFGG